MERFLAYQSAGVEPPPVIFGARPDGPPDLLDEPMQLSLADKSDLGISLEHAEGFHNVGTDRLGDTDHLGDHLQWELRMALEKIHSNAGHSRPIGGVAAQENKPFDGMDPVSSALLLELATTVMPDKQHSAACETRYSPSQRKYAIQRWMAKRARRHLTSQTKYRKMKDVAVSKARCKGGKFIKKSERERMAREEQERLAREGASIVKTEDVFVISSAATPAVGMAKAPWSSEDAWQRAYAFYAKSEE